MPGPHDQLVRFTFEHPERAAAELRAVLPPQVVAQLDWSSLRRESGSVVDEELRESQSDLLFSARLLGGEPLLLHSVAGDERAEAWMKTMGQILREEGRAIGLEEGLARGEAEGRAKERAEGVLRILEVRGIAVSPKARERVLKFTDLDTLDRWFRRAATATRLSEIW